MINLSLFRGRGCAVGLSQAGRSALPVHYLLPWEPPELVCPFPLPFPAVVGDVGQGWNRLGVQVVAGERAIAFSRWHQWLDARGCTSGCDELWVAGA